MNISFLTTQDLINEYNAKFSEACEVVTKSSSVSYLGNFNVGDNEGSRTKVLNSFLFTPCCMNYVACHNVCREPCKKT